MSDVDALETLSLAGKQRRQLRAESATVEENIEEMVTTLLESNYGWAMIADALGENRGSVHNWYMRRKRLKRSSDGSDASTE